MHRYKSAGERVIPRAPSPKHSSYRMRPSTVSPDRSKSPTNYSHDHNQPLSITIHKSVPDSPSIRATVWKSNSLLNLNASPSNSDTLGADSITSPHSAIADSAYSPHEKRFNFDFSSPTAFVRSVWRKLKLKFSDENFEHTFLSNQHAVNRERFPLLVLFWLIWTISNMKGGPVTVYHIFPILCFTYIFFMIILIVRPKLATAKQMYWAQFGALLLLESTESAQYVVYSARVNYMPNGYPLCDGEGAYFGFSSGMVPFIMLATLDLVFVQTLAICIVQSLGFILFAVFAYSSPCVLPLDPVPIITLQTLLLMAGWNREKCERRRFLQWYNTNRDLTASIAKVKKADEAKKNFLAYVHHELRVQFGAMRLAVDCANHELAIERELHQISGSQTPVNGDSSNSLAHKRHTSSEVRDLMTLITEQAECVSRILDDVLSLDKLDSGQFQLEVIPFTLRSLMDSAKFMFERLFEDAGVMLKLACAPSIPLTQTLLGDPHRLRQVVSNLLSNAKKFTPKGGTVTLSIGEASGSDRDRLSDILDCSVAERVCVRIAVTDTGVGISSEEQAKLFLPYSQIRAGDTQAGGGSGLGLALCSSLTTLHKGFLDFNSTLHKGSQFSFVLALERSDEPVVSNFTLMASSWVSNRTLGSRNASLANLSPRLPNASTIADRDTLEIVGPTQSAPPSPNATTKALSPPRSHSAAVEAVSKQLFTAASSPPSSLHTRTETVRLPSSESQWNGHNTLVVEDSLPNQKLLARLLKTKFGFVPSVADDGIDAIEMVKKFGKDFFSVIWMDRTMKTMGGVECTRLLRQEYGVTCPILAVTGNALADDQLELLEAGCDRVITKPASLAKLQQTLLEIGGARSVSAPAMVERHRVSPSM